MLCAISGEAPSVPVASTKSGVVFEKRLIEAYIAEHGKDPVTGEDLTTADLVELKSSRTVRPRPPTLTSIPSLLATFQNEWDALALETHTLRQQLTQTRQELSTALYQHDAATRVIARLLKERDEAREALSKISIGAGSGPAAPVAAGGADAMEVDDAGVVPQSVQDLVDETAKVKSGGRRKRAVPADWTTAESVSGFSTLFVSEPLYPGCNSIDLDVSGELALLGGSDGVAGIYSIPQQSLLSPLKSDDGAVVDALWAGNKAITGHSSGVVRVWDEAGNGSTTMRTHAGEVKALALHPSERILGSVGADKSWVLYDIEAGKKVVQIYGESELTSAHFHPDGRLFATGTGNAVNIYDVRTATLGATFGPLTGPVSSLHFSENGYWLALSVKDQSSVEIWDLRELTQTKAIDVGTRVDNVRWDYTGQFIATAGPSGVSVQQYQKKGKTWSEPLRVGVPAVATAWGPRAGSLVTVNKEGIITVLGAK
ncbi:uncharacterized protein LAJ45_02320 [Morchella importuna]|uniref:Pre-mRNA-processing factor 19 n=1 Tax=Morchella conica CCBAS932 TaxID=1392247 RepID=A0A3N4KR99_9PEZI|nr:uncharacterized protein LAJ45_02320 [Morchella importuna]KAH8153507.1 hypothetical protein LAJ45_02320 [Morchella importuna]RPB13124.1 Prp19-domain-containing protein [Morchella conica CCBAS932]